MPEKTTVNIMTSCDDNLALYIMPQLASIGVNLKQYDVNFYLFHSRINPDSVERLRSYAETFDNIAFREVKITDTEPYEAIASRGGPWPHEAYFSLCCHEYLPAGADRVMYIDAGDAVIDGDIAEFYGGDFEGLSLIASLSRFTLDDMSLGDINDLSRMLEAPGAGSFRPYGSEDLSDPKSLDAILEAGVFTSGCFMINLSQFRADGRGMGDCLYLYNTLCGQFPDRERIYFGDQGFLSVAFAGDIKYFGWPDNFNPGYAPYNFGVWFLEGEKELGYKPVIPHFAGVNYLKPWKARFSPDEIRKYSFDADPRRFHVPFRLNARQVRLYEVWWKYCEMTPIYNETNMAARAAARVLEEHYLPLCKWYNELADNYLKATGKNPPDLLDIKTGGPHA